MNTLQTKNQKLIKTCISQCNSRQRLTENVRKLFYTTQNNKNAKISKKTSKLITNLCNTAWVTISCFLKNNSDQAKFSFI